MSKLTIVPPVTDPASADAPTTHAPELDPASPDGRDVLAVDPTDALREAREAAAKITAQAIARAEVAEADVPKARDVITELRRAAVEDDKPPTPAALSGAEAKVKHAELLFEAAQANVDRAKAAERKAIKALVAAEVSQYVDPEAIAQAEAENIAAIRVALSRYVTRVRQGNAAIQRGCRQFRDAGITSPDHYHQVITIGGHSAGPTSLTSQHGLQRVLEDAARDCGLRFNLSISEEIRYS